MQPDENDLTRPRLREEKLERFATDIEAILHAAGEGIFRLDLEGRATFVNQWSVDAYGWDLEDLIGRRMHEVMHHTKPDGTPYPAEECPIQISFQTGTVQQRDDEVFWRSDGTSFPVEYISAPIREDGHVVGAVVTFRDISERKWIEDALRRSNERLRVLSEISGALGSSLNYRVTLDRLTELIVPRLADWCAVDLIESAGALRRVSIRHTDPEKVGLAQQLHDRYPPDPSSETGTWSVVHSGIAALYEEIDDELLQRVARDEEHLRILRELELTSAMVVPLEARGRTLGTLTLVSGESGITYNESDLSLAVEIGRRAATAVDNARLFEERSQVARTLQRSFLPPVTPAVPGLEIAARYVSAAQTLEIGGDFYDVFRTAPADWVAVVGDVCGKGVEAAAMTSLARYTVRAAAMEARKPGRVLAKLNEAILQQDSSERFCTVCYVRIRLRDPEVRLTVCCGGHPPALILRRSGEVESVGLPSIALGLFPDADLRDVAATLAPGDTCVIYTDGLVEARNPEGELGVERVIEELTDCAGLSAEEIAARLEKMAVEWHAAEPRDDIAILALRVPD